MRIFIAGIIIGMLTGAASAKDFGPLPEPPTQKADEQAYRDAIKRIPDPKSSSDPWGSVRDAGAGVSPVLLARSVSAARAPVVWMFGSTARANKQQLAVPVFDLRGITLPYMQL